MAELITREEAEWDIHTVKFLFDEETAKEILSITLSPFPLEDTLKWTGNQTGDFSVKGAYNSLREKEQKQNMDLASTSFQPSRRLWNGIWKANIRPKVRMFLWNICQNALPTRDNLFRRKIIPHPLCPICSQQAKTIEHGQYPRMDAWLQDRLEKPSHLLAFDLTATILWCIWKARNNLAFRGKRPSAETLIEEAEAILTSYSKWNPKDGSFSMENWNPPASPGLKLNVDASVGGANTDGAVADDDDFDRRRRFRTIENTS